MENVYWIDVKFKPNCKSAKEIGEEIGELITKYNSRNPHCTIMLNLRKQYALRTTESQIKQIEERLKDVKGIESIEITKVKVK